MSVDDKKKPFCQTIQEEEVKKKKRGGGAEKNKSFTTKQLFLKASWFKPHQPDTELTLQLLVDFWLTSSAAAQR